MFQTFHEPTKISKPFGIHPKSPEIKLALSATWRHGRERLDWILANNLACAYTPHPDRMDEIYGRLFPYIERGMEVRHHGYFPGKEIGHAHHGAAEKAMQLHFRAMEAILGTGEPVMTVHVGLDRTVPLDHHRVTENLTRLVEYGKNCGIQVNLENLKSGPTSHPETLLEWVDASGASITMDIGHAVSSKPVQRGDFTVPQIVDLFGPKLDEAHLYEYETDTHHAPKDLSVLGPILDRLILTNCRWWTIELNDYREIRHTHKLVEQYLTESSTRLSLLCRRELGRARQRISTEQCM